MSTVRDACCRLREVAALQGGERARISTSSTTLASQLDRVAQEPQTILELGAHALRGVETR